MIVFFLWDQDLVAYIYIYIFYVICKSKKLWESQVEEIGQKQWPHMKSKTTIKSFGVSIEDWIIENFVQWEKSKGKLN